MERRASRKLSLKARLTLDEQAQKVQAATTTRLDKKKAVDQERLQPSSNEKDQVAVMPTFNQHFHLAPLEMPASTLFVGSANQDAVNSLNTGAKHHLDHISTAANYNPQNQKVHEWSAPLNAVTKDSKFDYNDILFHTIAHNKKMPYNAGPVPRHNEPTGTTALPFARVKKLINLDQDIGMCSNQAAFVITQATEMFIQYLAEQGHNIVKSERKPRRNIQYRDLAGAVARHDNLEFLSDVIPKTVPYSEVKSRKAPGIATAVATTNGTSSTANGLESGQTTLDSGHRASVLNGDGANGNSVGNGNEVQEVEGEDEDPNAQLNYEMQVRVGRVSLGSEVNGGEKDDVEMN